MNPHATSLPFAEPWSLTLGLVGKGFVFAAIVTCLISAVVWILSRRQPANSDTGSADTPVGARFERFAKLTLWLGCLSIFGAFASLAVLFATEQFQYEYVLGHSAGGLPIAYRIAAVWSGQQGSFLLWAVTSALFAVVVAPFTGKYRRGFSIVYGFFLASLAGILAYETPFTVAKDAFVDATHVLRPTTGVGLTPALQNYWVIIHPPTIFLGFGSLTIMFAWAISAMMTKDAKSWIPMIRPWAILSGAILGLGLCMGGFWAYETLGWGGFWAWDPVENVSFVPWIFTIAFYHGIIVQTNRGRWIGTNLIMGGIPFVLFTFGTLMTRSGLLGDSSVHSFAEMNRVALLILAGIMFASIISLAGYYIGTGRKLAREAKPKPEGLDRESAYFSGVFLLSLIGVVAALGMAWSFISAIVFGKAAVVEAHLYQVIVVWFFIPLLLVLAIGPFMSWRAQSNVNIWGRLANVFGLSLGLTGVMLWLMRNPMWGAGTAGDSKPNMDGTQVFTPATVTLPFGIQLAPLAVITFLVFLAAFAAVANLWRLAETFQKAKFSVGGFISHIGVATLLAGLIVSRGLEHHEQIIVPARESVHVLDHDVKFVKFSKEDLHDRDNHAEFSMSGPDGQYTATPGMYYLPSDDANGKAMVWPHIQHHAGYDVYLSMAAPVIFATDEPMELKLGESKPLGDAMVKFVDWHAPKDPAAPNAQFTADIEISLNGKKIVVHPAKISTEEGLRPTFVKVTDDLNVTLAEMNANSGSITLLWPYSVPKFPLELFYKPMTILVWAGAGILFFGGVLSAIYRRFRRKGATASADEEQPEAPQLAANTEAAAFRKTNPEPNA